MNDLISRQALCQYALNQKDKSVTPNDIMRFPSAEQKTKCIAQIKIDQNDIEDFVNEKVNEIVEKTKESKVGKWVEVEKNEYEGFSIVDMRCNQCGKYAYLVLPKGTKCVYDYCPWCKVDMRGGKNEHTSK